MQLFWGHERWHVKTKQLWVRCVTRLWLFFPSRWKGRIGKQVWRVSQSTRLIRNERKRNFNIWKNLQDTTNSSINSSHCWPWGSSDAINRSKNRSHPSPCLSVYERGSDWTFSQSHRCRRIEHGDSTSQQWQGVSWYWRSEGLVPIFMHMYFEMSELWFWCFFSP